MTFKSSKFYCALGATGLLIAGIGIALGMIWAASSKFANIIIPTVMLLVLAWGAISLGEDIYSDCRTAHTKRRGE